MEVILVVKGVVFDINSSSPMLLLKISNEERYLPIWIGLFEAQAIISKLDNIPTPRPMTHDLLNNLIKGVGLTIEKIVISDLIENTYYAEIHLTKDNQKYVIDSRPSDAIALALRYECNIFAGENLMKKAKFIDISSPPDEKELLRRRLDEIDVEILGKYEM